MLQKIEQTIRSKAVAEYKDFIAGLRKQFYASLASYGIGSHYVSNDAYNFFHALEKNETLHAYVGDRACQAFMERVENLTEELDEIRDIAEGACDH